MSKGGDEWTMANHTQEMFVQNMAEQAHAAAKADGKSRRTIMYQDVCRSPYRGASRGAENANQGLANIVARNDNLEFLSDIVPRTTTMAELKKQQAIETGYSDPGAARSVPLPPGQTTLDSMRPQSSHMAAQLNATESTSTDRLTTRDHVNGGPTNGAGMLVFEHYEPNGSGKHDGSGDVEMS
jgi:hypothetical protein